MEPDGRDDEDLPSEELITPCRNNGRQGDKDHANGQEAVGQPDVAKGNFSARKRSRLLEPTDVVDLDDIEFLRRFVTEFGKIIPARLTGVTAHQQRQIRRGVTRARNMGLLA